MRNVAWRTNWAQGILIAENSYGEWGTGKSVYFIQTFKHSHILTFQHSLCSRLSPSPSLKNVKLANYQTDSTCKLLSSLESRQVLQLDSLPVIQQSTIPTFKHSNIQTLTHSPMQWGQSLSGHFLPHDGYSLPHPTANSQSYTVKLMQKGLLSLLRYSTTFLYSN